MKRTWKRRLFDWFEIAVICLIVNSIKWIKLPEIDWSNPVVLVIIAFLGGIAACIAVGTVIKKFKK